ncbi:MAG: UvrD-helicase domain-containing protein [bacterium]
MNNVFKKDTELVFPHIFQLSASAGSGKTHNLSLRYVQFLLSSNIKKPADHIGIGIDGGAFGGAATNGLNNIMAITFTNKSADEMKERILKLLKSIAIGRKDELNEIKNLLGGGSGNTDKYLEDRASALVDNIIKNYTNFNIKTIDSFLTDILRASLLETDIKPGFDITADKLSYIDFSIGGLLSAANEDEEIKKIFLDFIKNYVSIEGKTVFNPRSAITEIVRELGYIENNAGKYFSVPEGEDFIGKSHENIEKLLNKMESLLGDLAIGIEGLSGVKLNKTFQKGLSKIIKKDFTSSYWRKKNVGGIITGFKGVQDAEASANLQKIWDDIRDSIKDIILSAGGIKFYSYIKILNKCKKIIGEKSKNDGVIFLDELKRRVNGLIKSNAVPDIYFNMGERIYHYLIDEFQDTDRLQWENLKALVENSISNGGSLFYVGDKKQSIYRFKGGDADLFDDIIDDFRGNIIPQGGFYAEKLKDNYRSKELLVNFFNKTFNPENLIQKLLYSENKNNKADTSSPDISSDACYRKNAEELIRKIYENHEQHSAFKDAGFKGFIHVERFSEPDSAAAGGANAGHLNNGVNNGADNGAEINPNVKALFLDKTVSVINDLKGRNYGFKDIAILTRTNNDSSDIVLKLKKEKIPVKSDQSADARNNRLIKETIAFLKFLNNPADNLSFINFISGKIFASVFKNPVFIKSEINNFILNNRKEDFIYLKFKEWNFGGGEGGVNYAGSALWEDYLSELFNGAGFYPVYDTVCKFYEKFNIYEHFRNSNGFFMHLLELIKNREQEGENSPGMFIDFFEDADMEQEQFLIESGQIEDAVNVLTMHKSKGLQFPAVIIPYAGIKKTPVNRILTGCDDAICLRYTSKDDQEFLFGIDDNLEEVKSYIHEKSMNFIDELNLFYVSLTRAKDELYIMIPPKIGNNKNILGNLFFDEDAEGGEGGGNILKIGNKRNSGDNLNENG